MKKKILNTIDQRENKMEKENKTEIPDEWTQEQPTKKEMEDMCRPQWDKPKTHNIITGSMNFPKPEDDTGIVCDGELIWEIVLEGYICKKCRMITRS